MQDTAGCNELFGIEREVARNASRFAGEQNGLDMLHSLA
jgi:hypothetical protein